MATPRATSSTAIRVVPRDAGVAAWSAAAGAGDMLGTVPYGRNVWSTRGIARWSRYEDGAMTAHDPQRRAALVRALVEIVAERGLDAVSVREVAAHADVSIGAVQHHFRTKSAMLQAAMEDVVTRWAAELDREISDDPPKALRLIAHRLVPDRSDDADSRVWLAFVARAAVEEELAAVHADSMRKLEDSLVAGAMTGRSAPARQRRTIADEMAALMALVDGLTVAVLVEPDRMSPRRARTILDRHLDHMLAGG
ncbi:MAG: TetR family transcriptional regulator [Streptosporangiales bacterium]|nr:TetR family transcriptional regulator [Streptosporangiales bacterium]